MRHLTELATKIKRLFFFAKVLLRGKEEVKNKNQLIDCHHPLKGMSARGPNKNKG